MAGHRNSSPQAWHCRRWSVNPEIAALLALRQSRHLVGSGQALFAKKALSPPPNRNRSLHWRQSKNRSPGSTLVFTLIVPSHFQ
jgi:hypothetical protein